MIKTKYIAIALVATLIVAGLAMSTLSIFKDEFPNPNFINYSVTVNETKSFYTEGDYPGTERHASGWADGEFIVKNKISLGWTPERTSEPITLSQVGAMPGRVWTWYIIWPVCHFPWFSKYWYQVEVWDGTEWVELIGRDGIKNYQLVKPELSAPDWKEQPWNENLLDGPWSLKTFSYGWPDDWWNSNSMDIHVAEGDYYVLWYYNNGPLDWITDPNPHTSNNGMPTQILTALPNAFSILGRSLAGKYVRVALCSDWMHHDGAIKHEDTMIWVYDTILLRSGEASAVINSGPAGSTNFEEKNTMVFTVTTGYCGTQADGTPGKWIIDLCPPGSTSPAGANRNIVIRDETGKKVNVDGTATIEQENEKTKIYSWYIEPGTVQENDYYYMCGWQIAVKNTVTTYTTAEAFVVREGELTLGPIAVTEEVFIIDQENRMVSLKVSALGNSAGSGDVAKFKVVYKHNGAIFSTAFYGATFVENNKYAMETTFITEYTEGILTYQAWAGDSMGRPSVSWVGNSKSLDQNSGYKALTVLVTHNDLSCPGASIDINGEEYTASSNGMLTVQLPKDIRYKMTAEYNGLTGSTTFWLRDDDFKEIKVGGFVFLDYLVPILIFVVFLIVALAIPYLSMPLKLIIIVIGAIVAIFLYLLFSGLIVIEGFTTPWIIWHRWL